MGPRTGDSTDLDLPPGVEGVIFTPEQYFQRVHVLASQIAADYHGKEIVAVGILKGAAAFMTDLLRALYYHGIYDVLVDYMAVSSYGTQGSQRGEVRLLLDVRIPIGNRHVLLIEDIIDSGWTVDFLLRILRARNPQSIRVCALSSKSGRREVDVPIDYLGFDLPDRWVVGLWLDLNERLRTLPYMAWVKPQT